MPRGSIHIEVPLVAGQAGSLGMPTRLGPTLRMVDGVHDMGGMHGFGPVDPDLIHFIALVANAFGLPDLCAPETRTEPSAGT